MNQDYKELIEYLDEKFQKTAQKEDVDQRFNAVDKKFDVIDQRFEKIDQRFEKVDEHFDRLFDVFATKEDLEQLKEDLREDFSNLQTAVDAYAKRADSYFQEMVMLSHKVDRHEKWIMQIAEKLNLQLKG